MAIAFRGATSYSNGSGTATGVTVPVTGWTGADPQAGDIMFLVCRAGTAGLTVTQTGGSTWDIHSQGTPASSSYTFFVASRVAQGGDTAPVFAWGTAGRYCYAAGALYSTAAGTLSADTWAADVSTASGAASTSITPNPATCTSTGEASVILTCSRATTNSASWASYTYTQPSGWTAPAGGVVCDGTSTLNMRLGAFTYQLGLSGTVTPGAETLTDNLSEVSYFTAAHVLVAETTASSGPNYAGTAAALGGGSGTWANTGNAAGTDDGTYAVWTVP